MTTHSLQEATQIFETFLRPSSRGWEVVPPDDPLVIASLLAWGNPVSEEAKVWQKDELSASSFAQADPASDDDFSGECYVMKFPALHWSIESSEHWVRAEYIKIGNFLDELWQNMLKAGAECRVRYSIVLTGQPGIGKTVSIHYILRRRSGQKRPTAVLMSDDFFYFFCEAGVARILPQYRVAGGLIKHCWLLVDSLAVPNMFPDRVLSWRSLLVFASSPTPARWRPLKIRSGFPYLIYMNPWSRREIGQGTLLTPHSATLTPSELDERYNNYGPVPRICFLPLYYWETYVDQVQAAIADVVRSYRSILEIQPPQEQAHLGSHCIAFVRRTVDVEKCNPGDLTAAPVLSITPITTYVGKRMVVKLTRIEQAELITLYRQFQRLPAARSMISSLFEAQMHQKFILGCTVTINGMVRLEDKPQAVTEHQWHTSHCPLPSLLERQRQQSSSYDIHISPQTHYIYTPNEDPRQLTTMLYSENSIFGAIRPLRFGVQTSELGYTSLFWYTFRPILDYRLNSVVYPSFLWDTTSKPAHHRKAC